MDGLKIGSAAGSTTGNVQLAKKEQTQEKAVIGKILQGIEESGSAVRAKQSGSTLSVKA